MIDQDEARTRVFQALSRNWSMNPGLCASATNHIITALYAPRTPPREVVAPSGATYCVKPQPGVDGLRVRIGGAIWGRCVSVLPQDCATVADLLARPTDEVPS